MYPVSSAFLKAATSPNSRVVWKIDVLNQGTWLQNLPKGKKGQGGVIGWTVGADETRQIRRIGTIELQSLGRDLDSLIPVARTDLLHPASGNEFRIWKGFVLDDGSEEYAPLGVFQQTDPPKVLDAGSSISISMTLSDRSARVSALSWETPFPIADGMDLGAAVKSIINNRYPGLTYQFTPTNPVPGTTQNLTVAAQTLGASASSGSTDPMADAIKIANAAGMELFFDVTGQVVMRPLPDPTTAPVVASFIYGSSTPWLSIEKDPNPFGVYNGVICIGNGTGGAPVQNEAWDDDPNSPTYYLGPWGKRPYTLTLSTFPSPGQTAPNASAQAYQAALARLQLILKFMDGTTVATVPNPALAEGDCIYEKNPRAGIDGNYVISTLALTSDITANEPFATRPQKSAVV